MDNNSEDKMQALGKYFAATSYNNLVRDDDPDVHDYVNVFKFDKWIEPVQKPYSQITDHGRAMYLAYLLQQERAQVEELKRKNATLMEVAVELSEAVMLAAIWERCSCCDAPWDFSAKTVIHTEDCAVRQLEELRNER